MNIINAVEKSLNQARTYLEDSFIMVPDSDYWAFPHFRGKGRATECGGTSSALAALHSLKPSSTHIKNRVNSALEWLYSRQSSEGSWEASYIHCSEITARVLCDIKEYKPPSDTERSRKINKAIHYLESCYNRDGFFPLHHKAI